jgi:hypothetical protein
MRNGTIWGDQWEYDGKGKDNEGERGSKYATCICLTTTK